MRTVKMKLSNFFRSFRVNMQYFAMLWRDDFQFLLITTLTTFFNALFPIVNIIFPKLIIDAILNHSKIEYLLLLVVIFGSLNILFGVYNSIVSDKFLSIRGSMSSMRMLTKISRKASELDLSQIESKATIDSMNMAKDIIYRGTHQEILDSIVGVISSIVMIVTTIGIVASVSWWLVLLILLVCVVSVVINFTISHNEVEIQRCNQQAMTKMNYFTSLLDGKAFSKEIRLYNLGSWIEEKCVDIMREIGSNIRKKNKRWGKWRAFEVIISGLLNYGAYMYFAVLALFAKISVGDFTMLFQSVGTLRSNFSSLMSFFTKMMINAEYIDAYNNFMNLPGELDRERLTSCDKSISCQMPIVFNNVRFRYNKSNDTDVLENVNIKLEANSVYAIVGENGAGKTTLLNLLCRFYVPNSGEITMNGIDIRNIRLEEYRKRISALFQGFNNINFTLQDNITLDKETDIKRVDEVLKSVGLFEVVHTQQNGLNTYLGKTMDENGIMLSGGENQRLAIARALYRDSSILILDEPTSALDPLAEDALIRLIHEVAKDKCIIYVSHRLASARIADKVIYIHNHTVEGFDSHDRLYRENDNYKLFYDSQAKYYR